MTIQMRFHLLKSMKLLGCDIHTYIRKTKPSFFVAVCVINRSDTESCMRVDEAHLSV